MKKPSKTPEIIAPKTLVAANVIPKRISEVIIVPKTPASKVGTSEQLHAPVPAEAVFDEIRRFKPR